jgi:hypothetical protein
MADRSKRPKNSKQRIAANITKLPGLLRPDK